MSCFVVASKLTFGRVGSYGSAEISRTSSIAATNSAPTSGMHHCFFSHGLRTVFLTHGGRSHMNTTPPSRGPRPAGPAAVRSSAGAPPAPHYRLRRSGGLAPSHPALAMFQGAVVPPAPRALLRQSAGGCVRLWRARQRERQRSHCPPHPQRL